MISIKKWNKYEPTHIKEDMDEVELHMIFELPDEINRESKRMTVKVYYFEHVVHRLLRQLKQVDEDVEDI